MKNRQHFYRNNLACLIAQNPINDDWMGFVGFRPEDEFYGSIFKSCRTVSLHKYDITNTNSQWQQLWWMGFCTNPFSKDKTLGLLKKLADEIGKPILKNDIEETIDSLLA